METSSTPPKCRLLSLPSEFRLRIYYYVFCEYLETWPNGAKPTIWYSFEWLINGYAAGYEIPSARFSALVGTCRTIHDGSVDVLYDMTEFRFDITPSSDDPLGHTTRAFQQFQTSARLTRCLKHIKVAMFLPLRSFTQMDIDEFPEKTRHLCGILVENQVLRTCTAECFGLGGPKGMASALRLRFEDEVATLKLDLDSATAQAKVYRAVLAGLESAETAWGSDGTLQAL